VAIKFMTPVVACILNHTGGGEFSPEHREEDHQILPV